MKEYIQKNKILGLFILILFIACFLTMQIKDFFTTAEANSSAYKIRLLEITDSGTTDLSSLQKEKTGITVETMSMKKFVSLRNELDGLYDAIYIGSGVYSTKPVQGNDHNTKTVMNDITKLKAKEIIDNYINRGLYVFIHTQPFDEQQGGKPGNLYNSFNTYRSTSAQPNVIFVDNTSSVQLLTALNDGSSPYLSKLKQRPRLHITNKDSIIDYTVNPGHIYNIGDELSFEFEVSNRQDFAKRPITANLYLTVDKSSKLSKEQIVATTTLKTGPTGKITYKLPKTYSGLLYWKLEIIDQLNPNQLKDYDTGTIRFRGKKTQVSVLQVLPTKESVRTSSLLYTENMNQSFLKNEDYELNIQTKTMSEFNDYIQANYNSKQGYGLNGTYDMLIFGFADIYNTKAKISSLAADGVVEFGEKTKQSIMFTHDTIYASTAEWVSKFQKMTGQIEPETNLGLRGPEKSITVAGVNSGLLTDYPFQLDKTNNIGESLYRVATTHNQYFTLDLEDDSVVPWYNISGGSRDTSDSWNHYYTYSKGNITYSGTGHIFQSNLSAQFPVWEQKLFVNTMYRAFAGANHAPEITILSPENNSSRPSYQKDFTVSYTVNDWDFKDRNLLTSIQFKSDGVVLPNMSVSNKPVITGQTITQTFKNPLPEGGKLEIEITAEDKQGAKAVQSLVLNFEKKSVMLETTRHLSDHVINNELKKNEPVSITYQITPKSIPYSEVDKGLQGIQKMVLSNLEYSEKFPAQLDIDNTPEGTITVGDISSGYELHLPLGSVFYQLEELNGVMMYVPQNQEPVSYTLTVRPLSKGVYLLDQSQLEYDDLRAAVQLEEENGQQKNREISELFPDMGPLSPLGLPSDLSLYALNDVQNSGFTFHGRVIAGGSITLYSFNVGEKLGTGTDAPSTTYSIVAGKELKLGDGKFHGKAAYGTKLITPKYHLSKIAREPNLYADNLNRSLLSLSEELSQLPATAEPVITNQDPKGCQLILDGKDEAVNIFHVTEKVLAASSSTCISAPAGSTVIVNVDGASATMSGGLTLRDVDSNHVLYNFYNASSVSTTGIKIYGSILAPKANYDLKGDVIGTVIVRNMAPGGGFSIQSSPFQGDIGLPPTEPETPVTPELPDPSVPPDLPEPSEPSTPISRVTSLFPTLLLKAVVKVEKIEAEGTTMLVDTEHKITPIVLPEDADNKMLQWRSLSPDIAAVSNEGVVRGLKGGIAKLEVSAIDGSGVTSFVTIKVINRSLTILGPTTAKTQETLSLEAIYITASENVTGYRWEVKTVNGQNHSDKVALHPNLNDPSKIDILAIKKGTATVVVTALTDLSPNGSLSSEHTITISEPINEIFMDGPSQVMVGDSITLHAGTIPYNPDVTHFIWSLTGDGKIYATLTPSENGRSAVLRGVKSKDKVEVKLSLSDDEGSPPLTAVKWVSINPRLEGLHLSDTTLDIGGSENLLLQKLTPFPVDFDPYLLKDRLTWSSSAPSVVSINDTGIVTGIKKGFATITVTYNSPQAGQSTVTAKGTVKVNAKSSEDRY
ncbi:hypothetical protein J45TS6_04000 [Paenibacillus sp. J45TS6]|uniref:DUF5057 domain-containing protein n=1 Tax=Paenibacillus sp. J45TS6 TaxID=2807196 RepID=UPI001B09A062|nr:DUF5057 domain-containing protein [Paenibacillus sp. J45TS6]GIP41941.1 hypothetical protein J45TS6_04000 [Paenibacillus sp. J45TS6]